MALNKPPLHTDEQEARLLQTPRKKPLPVPLVGVFDEPSVLIKVNREWWSHVSGMIDVLSALDAWVGDDDEKTRGIREIAALLSTDWSAMFVQDVRWNDSTTTLEQQKNGVYEPVTDFNLLYDVIIEAWDKADNAQLVNAGQDITIVALGDELAGLQTWKTTVVEPKQEEQDDRLDAIETLQATHDTSIANLATRMDAAEDAIDALDARLDALELVAMWVETWDFETSDFGISPLNATYTAATGFVHTQGTGDVTLQSINTGAAANQIDTYEVGYLFSSGETGAPTNVSEQRLNSISPYANIHFTGSGNTGVGFIRVPNNPSVNAELQIQDFGNFTVKYIKFYGRGDNPF